MSGFTIVVFVTRKPGLSPGEFLDHWENHHVPLLQRIGGSRFPQSHTRHYLQHDETSPEYPVVPLVGQSADFTYDGFAVVSFENEAAFREFLPVMLSSEVLEDEERFTDRARMKAVALGGIRVAGLA
ncbi:EthD domain-containing protein [Aspergillus cavernicola]|uniref:EthD domain-containing protein n=1 Tax=Aspergillus cavernicola TaxID=176166 RepID=A0ABR4HVX4_9EURO